MSPLNKVLFAVISILVLSACTAAPIGTPKVPTVEVTPPVNEIPTTQSPATEVAPTAVGVATSTKTATPTETGKEYTCENLSINAPSDLFSGIRCIQVPESGGTDRAPWDIASSHTRIEFENYALLNTFHQPVIYLYPMDKLAEKDPLTADAISQTRAIIDGQKIDEKLETLPLVPQFNAAEMFHVKAKLLSFNEGKGFRYVTAYTQAVTKVTPDILLYVYQGISADGKWLVSVLMPITTSVLPPADNTALDQKFIDEYMSYIKNMTSEIENAPESTIQPSLEQLDAFVSSIRIKN